MSRFLLLLVFLIWMAWRSAADAPTPPHSADLALFFGLYAVMVAMLGGWSRLLAARVRRTRLNTAVGYFNRVVFVARFFVPVWFGIGTFLLGWGELVQLWLGPIAHWPVQFPGAVLGTLPALAAWAGLWWAQYPADQAIREQSLLVRLDDDLPIYRPPTLWAYLAQNVRLQIFFTSIPILLILLLHDAVMLVLWRGFHARLDASASTEGIVTFCCALIVFIAVPEVLVRILPTQPLPPGELRDRMEAMCGAHRLRFRQILLWHTHNRIANALVMGIIPQFRYVLLSDLLLEEMTDEQIEAVFAHELGHVVHRHMIWYLVFMKVLIAGLFVVALILEAQQHRLQLPPWLPMDLVMTLVGFASFVVAFGFVSRRFERQADVFAARTLEKMQIGTGWFTAHANPDDPSTVFVAQGLAPIPATAGPSTAAPAAGSSTDSREPVAPPLAVSQWLPSRAPAAAALARCEKLAARSHVGPLGATVFASALQRVAVINDIPLDRRTRWEGGLLQRASFVLELVGEATNNWLHGSIPQRMRALHYMSADPARTHRFDRRMARLYVTLLIMLAVSGTLAWLIKVPA